MLAPHAFLNSSCICLTSRIQAQDARLQPHAHEGAYGLPHAQGHTRLPKHFDTTTVHTKGIRDLHGESHGRLQARVRDDALKQDRVKRDVPMAETRGAACDVLRLSNRNRALRISACFVQTGQPPPHLPEEEAKRRRPQVLEGKMRAHDQQSLGMNRSRPSIPQRTEGNAVPEKEICVSLSTESGQEIVFMSGQHTPCMSPALLGSYTTCR